MVVEPKRGVTEAGPERLAATVDWRFVLPAQVLTTIAWVAVTQVYGQYPALVGACVAAAVGLIAAGAAHRSAEPRGIAEPALLATVYAALAWAMGGAAALPLGMLAASGAVRAGLPRPAFAERLAASLRAVGIAATCQWIATIGLRYLLLRARYWPVLSDLAADALAWLGLNAASIDGILYLNTSTQLLRVTPSAEKLGLLYVGVFVAGIVPWLVALRTAPRFYARIALATIGFIGWRYVALLTIYAQTQLIDGFWDPICNAAWLALFAIVIYPLLPNAESLGRRSKRPTEARGSFIRPVLLAAGLSGAAAWAFCFEDSGIRKPGRVIVDESQVPCAVDGAFSSLDNVNTLVMVYPRVVPPNRAVARLRRWVEAGGNLIVLDGFNNPTPSANEWLGAFGLRFDYGSRVTGEIQDGDGHRWTTATAVKVVGGAAFLNARFSQAIHSPLVVPSGDATLEVNEPVAAVATVGKGRIVAMGLADSFQDSVMGTTKTVPNEAQRELYEFEYALFRSVTGQRAGARMPLPKASIFGLNRHTTESQRQNLVRTNASRMRRHSSALSTLR